MTRSSLPRGSLGSDESFPVGPVKHDWLDKMVPLSPEEQQYMQMARADDKAIRDADRAIRKAERAADRAALRVRRAEKRSAWERMHG